jgi:Fe-S-cluster-containing hydrogenase component 2
MSIYFDGAQENSMALADNTGSRLKFQDSASVNWWTVAQYIVLLAGMALVAALLLKPKIGLLIMWNMLIPIAPVLIVVAPGLWRNICPMATFSLIPRQLGFSAKRIPSRRAAALMMATGLAGLLIIVPLRHVSLNTDGVMTALMLLIAAVFAISTGAVFEWRSGWCNSLCPIHPVEKLYGFSPASSLSNARCDSCRKCTSPCPDSTRSMNSSITGPTRLEKIVGHFMIGGFAGFIWGWYRLPDYFGHAGIAKIGMAYFWSFTGALTTLTLYAAARTWLCRSKSDRALLVKVFATSAVSTYYWYRIPALVGFGPHPGTGLLYNLAHTVPDISLVSHILTTSFFIWFLVIRDNPGTSWLKRPSYEQALQPQR